VYIALLGLGDRPLSVTVRPLPRMLGQYHSELPAASLINQYITATTVSAVRQKGRDVCWPRRGTNS